jgi:sulfite exporter TauE/SafE
MTNIDYITAFSIGLFSSGHCFGMCGGIIGFLSLNTKNKKLYPILYNLGRILTYVFITLFVNFFGLFFFKLNEFFSFLLIFCSNIILIFIGLYIANIINLILFVEMLFSKYLNKIFILINKIKYKETILNSFFLGMAWGFVPCGLVYSTILWGVSYHSCLKSVLLIIFFGMGTLPSMLFASASGFFKKVILNKKLKTLIGLLIILFAVINLFKIMIYKSCH